MSEFVNYNKRSIKLPPGCKDLIDVLRPKASRTTAIPAPGVTMSDDETGTISSIPKYIDKFLKSRQMLLLIYMPDEQVSFGIARFPDGPISASIDVVENPKREERVRVFFVRYGLEVPVRTATPPEFIPGTPVTVTFPIRPFPSNAPRLVEITAAVFRELCDVTEETPLHFRYYSLA